MDYSKIVETALQAILCAAAPYLIWLFGKGVDALFIYLKTKAKNTRFIEAINTIQAVVTAVNETARKGCEEKAKDGKLTKEDGLYLADLAFNEAKKQLGPKGMEFLRSVVGDAEGWIKTQIEVVLAKLKGRYL